MSRSEEKSELEGSKLSFRDFAEEII